MTTPSPENLSSTKLDSIAWEEFYREHHGQVLSLLIGILRDHTLAQEAAQNAFVKAVEKIHEIEVSARKAWLFRVAVNEAWLIRRKQQTEHKHLQHVAQHNPTEAEAESSAGLVQQEQVHQLQQAIQQLPHDQRTVVLLRLRDEQTFAEIAQQLNVPLGTVLTRMRLALDKLRKTLHSPD